MVIKSYLTYAEGHNDSSTWTIQDPSNERHNIKVDMFRGHRGGWLKKMQLWRQESIKDTICRLYGRRPKTAPYVYLLNAQHYRGRTWDFWHKGSTRFYTIIWLITVLTLFRDMRYRFNKWVEIQTNLIILLFFNKNEIGKISVWADSVCKCFLFINYLSLLSKFLWTLFPIFYL